MNQRKFFICAVILFFLPQSVKAFCEAHSIHTYIDINPGNVQYITTKSRDEFAKGREKTMGITDSSSISLSISPQPKIKRSGDKICAYLDALNFKIKYKEGIKVYIDKKYKPGSCEYEIILKHENYHVAVHQQALQFFKPDIKQKIHEIVNKIHPTVVHSEEEATDILNSQVQQVSVELKAFLEKINQKIEQKNALVDTAESYKKTSALCKNW